MNFLGEMFSQDVQSRYSLEDGTPFEINLIGPKIDEQTENCREQNYRFYRAVLSWAKDWAGISTSFEKNRSLMEDGEAMSSAIRAVLQYPILHLGLDCDNKARIFTKYWYRPLV